MFDVQEVRAIYRFQLKEIQMDYLNKRLALTGVLLMALPIFGATSANAATPVNLSHQQLTALQSFAGTGMYEISRAVSRSETTHIRIQQTYKGYDVWGADAVIHLPKSGKTLRGMKLDTVIGRQHDNTTMNGTFYAGLDKDLAQTRESLLNDVQADKALSTVVTSYQQKAGRNLTISAQEAKRIVYIDKNDKAHWAYHVSFDASAAKAGELPAKPNYLIDAESFDVYAEWNNMQTADPVVDGGGFGGNKKMGEISYDGTTGDLHYAKLSVSRNSKTKICSMDNTDVQVMNAPASKKPSKIMTFKCASQDKTHSNLYWDGDQDAVNGGYSPVNDALFGGIVIKGMYKDWYDLSVLNKNGKPMKLVMVVHEKIDNAYWDGSKMTFGDGVSMFYPLTSLGVAAHEISHGFTEQHSNLIYYGQSGGMNEAFSDMAAQAAEFYAYNGKNSWQIGPEIFKAPDKALRYMDQPSKDCEGAKPGQWCSIDSADQYYNGLDVHYSSGVFNRAFYLMGTADGWSARKAFDVMVNANQNYWTKDSTFEKGACGVISAAKDLGYDVAVVENAFKAVKVDISDCDGSTGGGFSV